MSTEACSVAAQLRHEPEVRTCSETVIKLICGKFAHIHLLVFFDNACNRLTAVLMLLTQED